MDRNENEFDRLERATQALQKSQVPAGPGEELLNATLREMRNQRSPMRFPILMRMAAAILLGLLLGGAWLAWPDSPRSFAFAQVAARAQQTRSVAFSFRPVEAVPGDELMKVVVREREFMRLEAFDRDPTAPEGARVYKKQPKRIGIANLKTGQMLSLFPEGTERDKEKQAITMNQTPREFDFYAWLGALAKGSEKRLEDRTINGRAAAGFEVTHESLFLRLGEQQPQQTVSKVWVDQQTRLPVRIETMLPGDKAAIALIEDIRFDLPAAEVADAVFDMKIPEGYKHRSMGGILASELKPAPTPQQAQELLTLTLGVGIGPLKFGDSRQRIIEVLGPVEETVYTDRDMRYMSKGLMLLVHPQFGLIGINAISRQYSPIFSMNDFPGRTDKGIAMGASREQVEAAHGKPDQVQEAGGRVVLRYNLLNGYFTLDKDRVVQANFSMPTEQLRQFRERAPAATRPVQP